MQVSATWVSVDWRRAGGGDVVDPPREAAPAWRPRWCLLWRSCVADDQAGVDGPCSMVSGLKDDRARLTGTGFTGTGFTPPAECVVAGPSL